MLFLSFIFEISEKFFWFFSYNIYKIRWKFYRDYLNYNKSKYNIVLNDEIKDTLFQGEFLVYLKIINHLLDFLMKVKH